MPELQIIDRVAGAHVTRIVLNTNSYVVAHMDGRYTCIHHDCITRRIANDCVHVAFVREHDRPDDEGAARDDATAAHDALPPSESIEPLDPDAPHIPPF